MLHVLFPSANAYSLCIDDDNCNQSNVKLTTSTNQETDTLYYDQAEILLKYRNSFTQENDQAIQTVCELFLTTLRASVRDSSYDSLIFIDDCSISCPQIQYRLSEYEYLTLLYSTMQTYVTSDSLTFRGYSCSVNNGSATASIVEDYIYHLADSSDSPSERIREYYFSLKLKQGRWLITGVTTNDPWESSQEFKYEPINCVDAVDNAVNPGPSIPAISVCPPISRNLYLWSYSSPTAVQYAATWYNGNNYAVFGDSCGGTDCMNFASQCVWAGLGGTNDAGAYPAVSKNIVGQSSSRVWCKGEDSTYYNNYLFNWSWTSCCSFSNLINTSDPQMIGPWGYIYFGSIIYANEGDVLLLAYNGSPSTTTVDHAMFITEVTGTLGNQSKNTIKIAAHTTPSNSAYQLLSEYAPLRDPSSFADVKVLAGFYDVSQN